ncbi:glutathione s-transferase [Ophiostoma piceae UAMH 11346]|uniref:Glutathione s-transferase n=1 Tax=Ophiostoma piceae (strain UAMH 11346) TaxID=1262450 RepID=S3BWT0_OPHP1|nr:glutathione s-transferase [Ophiostoma piceae UAMH 11346]
MSTPLITFYHYAFSPYARRIQWYLALRGLPFSECIQPPTLPRPDLARLGVRHRRIPVVAIDRDVYLDTRLILRKLEAIEGTDTVKPPLGVDANGSLELLALERLLDILTVDTNVFLDTARLIPANVPVMKDPAFGRDRADFLGTPLSAKPPKPAAADTRSASSAPPASKALVRAESLAEIRHAASILETSLLADGRDWILKTAAPSLADIEAIWPFHWLTTMPGAFEDGASPAPALSPEQFPRLFAWIGRFNAALKAARKSATQPKPKRVDGAQAAEAIWASEAKDSAEGVDGNDPVARAAGLQVGQQAVVWPIDTGTLHKDVGRLVRLTADEAVVEVSAPESSQSVFLHAPRHMFRVRPQAEAASKDAKL